MPTWDRLGFWVEEGGWGMWPIFACGVLLLGLVIERISVLWHTRGPSRALTDAIEIPLREGDLAEAMSVAMSSRGPCARVAARVLREALGPEERAEAARIEALANELPAITRNVGWFGAIANLATLFGLLGAVTGLGVGFGLPRDAVSRAVMLAKAISESMHCTAGGLFVSIVALASSLALRPVIEARVSVLEAESHAVVNLLVTYRARIRWIGRRPYVEPKGYRS